jgi:hypoxanthine-guanine phosphoribosyltransferase
MKVLQAYSKQKIKIADNYSVEISVRQNDLNIPLDSLFSMAMRKNIKRQFLFVSKLIGKHIPIIPSVISVTGGLLAELFMRETGQGSFYNAELFADALSDSSLLENAKSELTNTNLPIDKPTLFLGFAETATGLAQAVFRPFCGDCVYAHTTREIFLDRQPDLLFEEEHSHATSHLCYFDNIEYLKNAKRIVLIDDEITTGKTTLNFIKALLKNCNAREFVVLSILDWRNREQRQNYMGFEKEFGVTIKCISLVKGDIKTPKFTEVTLENTVSSVGENVPKVFDICLNIGEKFVYKIGSGETAIPHAYSVMTGRFGISSAENRKNLDLVRIAALRLKSLRKCQNSLCIGMGEFIYIPAMLAGEMGEGILYFSSTLSPIIPCDRSDYPVKSDITYTDEFAQNKANSIYHIYNILPEQYPEVFIFSEQGLSQNTKNEITTKLGQFGVKNLIFVSL